MLMGYQHNQHISYWSNYTRYRERLHSFIHGTGKMNFTEGIQEHTHTFRPTKHHVNSHQQPATTKESMTHTQPCHSTLLFFHSNGPQQRTLNISFTAIQFTSSLLLLLGALSMTVLLLKKLALLNVTSKYCVPFQF